MQSLASFDVTDASDVAFRQYKDLCVRAPDSIAGLRNRTKRNSVPAVIQDGTRGLREARQSLGGESLAQNRTDRSATPSAGAPEATGHRDSRPVAERVAGFRDRLVRLGYRFVFHAGDAEDVAQETLTKALGRVDQLRDPDRLWSWLARILVTTCADRGRSKDVRRSVAIDAIDPLDSAADHREAIELSEGQRRLVSMIDRLPRRQREVLVLRHLEGMSFSEVAEVLQMKESTARVQAQNARENLRTWLVGAE